MRLKRWLTRTASRWRRWWETMTRDDEPARRRERHDDETKREKPQAPCRRWVRQFGETK